MQNREYNKLFLGANEDLGKDKISLTYGISSKQFVFYTDSHNVFTYPSYNPALNINSTSLINDGAFGGIYPAVSDRVIYTSKCTVDDNMVDEFGVYLCTWLYKPELDSDINMGWKDRWYNPACISEKEAMLIPFDSGHTAIKDDESILLLEPGVSYNYFHFGNYNNQQVLSGIDDNLTIHFENWNEDRLIQENVIIQSDKNLIVNRDIPLIEQPVKETINANETDIRNTNKVQNDYILDLTNQAAYAGVTYLSKTDVLGCSGDITCSVWMKSDNWNNGNRYPLISNGFRSGWDLIINSGFYNPLLVFVSNTDGKIIVYNIEGKLVYNYDLSHTISQIISYVTDDDLYLYVLAKSQDTNYYIYKVDITSGDIIKQSVQLTYDESIKIYLNNTDELYIFYKLGANYRKRIVAKETLSLKPAFNVSVVPNNNYDIDLNNTVISSEYPMDVDNYNNIWKATPDGIYRGLEKIYDVVASKIRCSHDDKLWVIVNPTEQDQNYRLNIYDISNIDSIISNSFLSLLATLDASYILDINYVTPNTHMLFDLVYINNETEGYVIDLDRNLLYKITSQGIVNSFNFYNPVNILDFNTTNFTTYAWNRKFNYVKNGKISVIELNISTLSSLGALSKIKLVYPADNLIDHEWHHFSVVIDKTSSYIRMYLDTKLVNEESYSGDDIYYIYESPLLIGARSGRTISIPKELKMDAYNYFGGYIDDFRIYDRPLSQSDIERIYTNKFRYKDLVFNLALQSPLYYVEEIDRFFKFNMPGSKSPYYNIKICGINVSSSTKAIIETIIKNSIKYIAPAYTELYKIIWVD